MYFNFLNVSRENNKGIDFRHGEEWASETIRTKLVWNCKQDMQLHEIFEIKKYDIKTIT